MGCSGAKGKPAAEPSVKAGTSSSSQNGRRRSPSRLRDRVQEAEADLRTEADSAEVPKEPPAARILFLVPREAPEDAIARHGPVGPRCSRCPLESAAAASRRLHGAGVLVGTSPSSGVSYSAAANATADYLVKLISDQCWVKDHDDVAYYFKAPLLLANLRREEDARRALEVVARYVDAGGSNSSCETYSCTYPQCPWLWICWAATLLGAEDLADRCYEKLCRYQHRITESGLVQAPYSDLKEFEADFFATAMIGKAALLRKRRKAAAGAGDALLRALEANRVNVQTRRRFSFRWSWHGLAGDEEPGSCILQGRPGQQFQMLGFPALVLQELARAQLGRRAAYREAAGELVDFLRGCSGLVGSPSAHVVAAAAAFAHDCGTARQIADRLVAQQQVEGTFGGGDPESWAAVDSAAETAFWLRHVDLGLASTTKL